MFDVQSQRAYEQAAKNDPYLDQGMRVWIAKMAKTNAWRVPDWYKEDLLGDGYLCYYKCRERYLKTIQEKEPLLEDQKKWLMSLVQRSFFNHISTVAGKRKDGREYTVSQLAKDEVSTDALWEAIAPAQQEEGSFMALLMSAPAEIKQLIQLLATDVTDAFKYEKRQLKRFKVRETHNEFFCRVLGVDPTKNDIVARIKAHFG